MFMFEWKHLLVKRDLVYIVVVWVGSAPLIMRMHYACCNCNIPPTQKKKFLEHNKKYNNSANNDKKKMF